METCCQKQGPETGRETFALETVKTTGVEGNVGNGPGRQRESGEAAPAPCLQSRFVVYLNGSPRKRGQGPLEPMQVRLTENCTFKL